MWRSGIIRVDMGMPFESISKYNLLGKSRRADLTPGGSTSPRVFAFGHHLSLSHKGSAITRPLEAVSRRVTTEGQGHPDPIHERGTCISC
jgi:hypothetical protein